MRADRKKARDFVKSIKTRDELDAYLNMLNLTDEERDIARMTFSNGWSITRIAIETGYSEDQVKRKVCRIYDRML